jgi:hypothetical protein
MTRRGRDQRGLSESTQWAVLWPLILLVSLGIIQAGIYLHGRNVAQRAATAAVDAARGSYGSVTEARQLAEGIARSGGLRSVWISIDRGPAVVTAEVRADPVLILDIGVGRLRETAIAPREKVSQP